MIIIYIWYYLYPKHYEKPIHWRKCFYPKNYLNYNKEPKITTDTLSNITNCIKGSFHSWEFSKDNKTFQCTICKEFTSKITVNPKSINEITKIYKNIQLKDLAVKYCFIDGNLHLFQLQNENGIDRQIDYWFGKATGWFVNLICKKTILKL